MSTTILHVSLATFLVSFVLGVYCGSRAIQHLKPDWRDNQTSIGWREDRTNVGLFDTIGARYYRCAMGAMLVTAVSAIVMVTIAARSA